MGRILDAVSTVYSEYLLLPVLQAGGNRPETVDLSAPLVKFDYDKDMPWREQSGLRLNLGFMSAAMQSVTGHDMAIALAKEGGLGTIFCSQPVDKEVEEIRKTKRDKGGFVTPDVIAPYACISEAAERARRTGYSRFVVTENGQPDGKVVGLLTRELYDENAHGSMTVAERMISNETNGWQHDRLDRYIAFEDEVGDDLSRANELMHERARSRLLLIVDKEYRLKRAVFRRDVEEHKRHEDAELVDGQKRYRVAAAVNTHDYKERVPAVLDAGADVLVIDSSQGHTEWQADILRWIKETHPEACVISGNYVTPEGFDFAVKHGADAVKIGIGPGSICTTRTRFGGGCGQAAAVKRISDRRDAYLKETGNYVPLIADGGIVTLSDVIIAYALGADVVMMGRFFAGYHESPTDVQEIQVEAKDGGTFPALVKPYWGEGSERAKAWRKGRYDQTDIEEGIEGYVPYKGHLNENLPISVREIRTGISKFGYSGVEDLKNNAQLILQTEGSRHEGRPHDVLRIR